MKYVPPNDAHCFKHACSHPSGKPCPKCAAAAEFVALQSRRSSRMEAEAAELFTEAIKSMMGPMMDNKPLTPDIDLGSGNTLRWVEYEGDLHAGANHYHLRPDGGPCMGFIAIEGGAWARDFEGTEIATWKIEQLDPLSLSPSLLCKVCGDHCFIRDGRRVQA